MGKIVILDENTANKIAAGEVVERPASVIKELVENSIDAGATAISVDIKNGGIPYIKVTDNGAGMDEDDVEIAFERHSTSKIRNSTDLEDIRTLGFRGEALASIAAVSDVELVTRVKKNDYGMAVRIMGGNLREVKQTGCPVGTTFIIRELFYNTPARYKFLKKDSTEAGYISDMLNRIALGNPEISIKLNGNGSNVMHTPGNNDLLSTIFSIYGRETVKSVLPINYEDGKFKITGYAGKPEIARANRNYQSFYINGRYIKSRIISQAVEEAYNTMLMKGKHAFIILKISLNPLMVDVNVHPTKAEVRFSQEQEIFKAVYHAISSALLNNSLIRNVSLTRPDADYKFGKKPEFNYEQEAINAQHTAYHEPFTKGKTSDAYIYENVAASNLKDKKKEEEDANITVSKTAVSAVSVSIGGKDELSSMMNVKDTVVQNTEAVQKNTALHTVTAGADAGAEEAAALYNKDTLLSNESSFIRETANLIHDNICADKNNATMSANITSELKDCVYIGQAFSTFIILQHGNELLLIDQHAAHERIVYERLIAGYKKNESMAQYLITPLVIELTNQEMKIAQENTDIFNKLGFIYENFGNNSLILRSVPVITDNDQAKEAFLNAFDRFAAANSSDFHEKAEDILYNMACKAAIKANKKLDDREVQNILDELSKLDNPYSCPHGRPTIIKLTRYELEKRFKRIV